MFYLAILTASAILYWILKKKNSGKKIFLITVLFSLCIISSLRSKIIGADFQQYIYIFENIQKIITTYPIEKGFLGYNWLISLFTNDYVVFSIITSIICYYILYKHITKNVDEKYYWLIIFIFIANPYLFIQSTFNIIRQTLSTCLIILGINFLKKNKVIPFLLIGLLAAQFHSIGYIYILIVCAAKFINWDKKKLYALFLCSVITYLLRNTGILSPLVSIFGYEKYLTYSSTLFDFVPFVLFIFIILFTIIKNYVFSCNNSSVRNKSSESNNQNKKFFVDMYILSLSILPTLIMNDIMYRIYIGLQIITLPAIPTIIKMFPQKQKWVIISFYVLYNLLLLVFFIYSIYSNNNIHYLPFKFYWE